MSSVSSRGSVTASVPTLDDEVGLSPLPFFTLSSGQPGSPPSSPRMVLSPTAGNSRSHIPMMPRSLDGGLLSPPRSPSRAVPSFDLDSFTLLSKVVTPPLKPQSAPIVAVTPLSSPLPSSSDLVSLALDEIPRFYQPRSVLTNSRKLTEDEIFVIDSVFRHKKSTITNSSELVELVTTSLGLSKYFSEPLFKRLLKLSGVRQVVDVEIFVAFWKSHLRIACPFENFFNLVKQDANDYMTRSDFREFLWVLLDTHPGLLFLRDSPEFQERYADTVICRIFYQIDRKQVGKIHFREFKRLGAVLVKSWLDLDQTEDINTIRQFFSYEHFYVLYCKFWDLDADHDFLIDREDLLKYDGHAFSPKLIDRVFAIGVFTSGIPGKMNYDDFVWFILCDEDKTTDVSLEFFFNLCDIDGDGVIRDHEMIYFYQDQIHRLACVNQEAPAFADIMCQLNDLIKPKREGQFTLRNFLHKKFQNAGIFFSVLLSLNKFMAYESRDPFQIKQDLINNPDLTDWDRFCLGEYVRLAMEAGTASAETTHSADNDYLRNVA